MNIEGIKSFIETSENYKFLKENEHLGDNIILLTLGGSWAYGTNVEDSDIDIRGIALNSKREILLGSNFDQVLDSNTDTTIYSVKKMISLLSQCNPNCIEILGCKPEHYFKLTPIGELLLKNKDIFLSKRCIHTFGGYATSQLRRLENISNKYIDQAQQEKHILDTINQAEYSFKDHYFPYNEGNIKLYIDKAINEEYETEIFIDTNLKHYPLRDYANLWNEYKSIVSSYNKIGKRNQRALDHKKIGKHSMHLVRLEFMCLDILKYGEINTYREKEHNLLMEIRNGRYLDENHQPIKEFYDLVDDLENQVKIAAEKTELPDHPNMRKIENLLITINDNVIGG